MDFFNVHVSPRSRELVDEVLASGWLSEGKMTRRFEQELSERLGILHPVALNSGTAALHLGLALAGVRPGDEVILPPQTFVATGLAILMHGATPVFADVDALSGNITSAAIERAITPRTRVVLPVHWGGYPCDLDEINTLAKRHGLTVIEDAAHALGATYRGRPIGAVSRFTAFSFQAIKHVTTGDGGALSCSSPADARAAVTRRWFGIDRDGNRPSILGERVFDIETVGYKSHMNDLAAALGLGNLEDFPARLARRQLIARRYREALAGVAGLRLPPLATDRTHACWLFTILVERREDFIRKLLSRDIPASVVHLRIDRYTVFGGIHRGLEGQTAFDERQVSIPVHDGLTDDDVQSVIAAIRSGW
jgi:dTDP-4-amino-4,6-dideoxygalactose transaminase